MKELITVDTQDQEQRACLGKKGYWSRKRAKKIAKQFNQKVYKCPFCEGYHLTKKTNYWWRRRIEEESV